MRLIPIALSVLLLALPADAQGPIERLSNMPADLPRAIDATPLSGTDLDPFTGPAYVRAAQEALRAQGRYRGPINGQADTRGFADALRAWQRSMGMPATGRLDEPSAVALAHGLRPDPRQPVQGTQAPAADGR